MPLCFQNFEKGDLTLKAAGYRDNNFAAMSRHPCLKEAAEMAALLRTALGPRGRDKLIVSETGEVIVTADGCTLLSQMGADKHPVGRLLLSLAQTHEASVGDGTTSVVVLMGQFCEAALRLTDEGVHPWEVIEGYHKALGLACEWLQGLVLEDGSLDLLVGSSPLDDEATEEDSILKAVYVALGDHIREDLRAECARGCLDAARHTGGNQSLLQATVAEI